MTLLKSSCVCSVYICSVRSILWAPSLHCFTSCRACTGQWQLQAGPRLAPHSHPPSGLAWLPTALALMAALVPVLPRPTDCVGSTLSGPQFPHQHARSLGGTTWKPSLPRPQGLCSHAGMGPHLIYAPPPTLGPPHLADGLECTAGCFVPLGVALCLEAECLQEDTAYEKPRAASCTLAQRPPWGRGSPTSARPWGHSEGSCQASPLQPLAVLIQQEGPEASISPCPRAPEGLISCLPGTLTQEAWATGCLSELSWALVCMCVPPLCLPCVYTCVLVCACAVFTPTKPSVP